MFGEIGLCRAMSRGKRVLLRHAVVFSIVAIVVCNIGGVEALSKEDAGGKRMVPVVGIDLGTTYSCVAVYTKNGPEVVEDSLGGRTTPSWVFMPEPGSGEPAEIGDSAKGRSQFNPGSTYYNVKRIIGLDYDKANKAGILKLFNYQVTGGSKGETLIVHKFKNGTTVRYPPEKISAVLLRYFREMAQKRLECDEIEQAVVTVPAYFSNEQREATKNACLIAGFKEDRLRILNEPTAAAIAYGFGEEKARIKRAMEGVRGKDGDDNKERKVVVFDLGGGTFDVSILVIDGGIYEVLAVGGENCLGGENFDDSVIEVIKKEVFKDKNHEHYGADEDSYSMSVLKKEVELAKRKLSGETECEIIIDNFYKDKPFRYSITRDKFETINRKLFKKVEGPLKKALKDAGLRKDEIDDVVFVGGSTRIPAVKKIVTNYFEDEIRRKRVVIHDHKDVNPDEAVAIGAAIHAASIAGVEESDIVVIDVAPLTLGIETTGGIMTKLIPSNTPIPVKKEQIFSTAVDNQATVQIKVFEGERPMTKDNILLGYFDLTGIPPAPRGVPQIQVTFEIDVSGVLKVTAVDLARFKDKDGSSKNSASGKETLVVDNKKRRFGDAEIQRAKMEAEKFAEDDRINKERVEAKNLLDNYVHSVKNQINDEKGLGGKIGGEDKKVISDAVDDTIRWISSNGDASKEDYEEKKYKLESVVNPITSKLYGGAEGGHDSGYDSGYDSDDGGHEDL